ncbi:MAG: FG-GAP repeat domain-containing protein [Microthrixaceae bacterium]
MTHRPRGATPYARSVVALALWMWTVVDAAGVAGAVATTTTAASSGSSLVARDVASQVGLIGNVATWGQNCVFDYNADGQMDLLLSTHGSGPWPLLEGRGSDPYVEVSSGSFLRNDRHGCAVGDFGGVTDDGQPTGPDGRPDVYATVGACRGTCTKSYPNELWIQRSDRTYVNMAAAFHVEDAHGRGRSPMAFDYDNDGLTDLVVGNDASSLYFSANRLYRNVGGDFVEKNIGTTAEVSNVCTQNGDFNGDGWRDLVICAPSKLYVYKNNGGTSFSEVTTGIGLPTGGGTKDVALVDINGDGRQDVVLLQWTSLRVRLNRNDTFGTNDYVFPLKKGSGLAVADADGDGRPDIFLTQQDNAVNPHYLLLNKGPNATGGWRFATTPIPQLTIGNGDTVQPIPNWQSSGRAAFLVNNGKWDAKAPRQLIALEP